MSDWDGIKLSGCGDWFVVDTEKWPEDEKIRVRAVPMGPAPVIEIEQDQALIEVSPGEVAGLITALIKAMEDVSEE